MLAAPSALRAQTTATIGHSPIADAANTATTLFSALALSGSGNRTDVYVPFQINSLGNYSLTSVSLLLSGSGSVSGFSLLATSSLGTANGTPGTSLATFTGSGTLSSTPTVFTFSAGSSSTLAANTTYYLYVGLNAATTINWIRTSVASSGGEGSTGSTGSTNSFSSASLNPTTGTLAATDNVYFRYFPTDAYGSVSIADAGGSSFAGFSITASAMSAVPEPSTYAALCGAGALVTAVVIRRRGRQKFRP